MEPVAFSIDEFCKAHRISRAMYYKLDQQGLGPRVMCVGTRTLISKEAAADWRRDREENKSPQKRYHIEALDIMPKDHRFALGVALIYALTSLARHVW